RVLERRARKERVREILDDQGEDEEVEGVERPAEETGQDGVALVGGVSGRARNRHARGSITNVSGSKRESGAEVELGAAAVERVRDLEIEVQDRGVDEEAAADAAEERRAADALAVRGHLAAVEEHVEPGPPHDVERRRERHAQLGGPDQALIAAKRAGRQAAQAGAAEQPLLVRRQRRRRGVVL